MPGLLPGADWATLDDLEPATNKLHQDVSRILASADFGYLENAALAARKAKDTGASTGITCTGTAPVERLAVSPEFITFPGMTDAQNQVILDFRNAAREYLADLEAHARQAAPECTTRTTLSAMLGTRRADIIHRCTYSLPHRALWDGRLVAELIYRNAVSWEQLLAVYGDCDVY